MQDKPDSTVGQSSTSASRKRADVGKDSSAQSSTGTGSGATSNTAGARGSNGGVVDQAKETISNVASNAGEKVASRLDTQRTRTAENLGSVAQALRQTSDQLREKDQ